MQDAPRKPRKPPVNPARTIETPDGPMTRAEAAAFYRIPKNTLIRRIWSGFPPEKWFEPPYKPARRPNPPTKRKGGYITPYGRKSMSEMATILGLTFGAMRARLYVMGWSQEEAFNTPAFGQAGRQFVLSPEEYQRRRAEVLEADFKERLELEHQRRLAYNKKRKAKRLREKSNAVK